MILRTLRTPIPQHPHPSSKPKPRSFFWQLSARCPTWPSPAPPLGPAAECGGPGAWQEPSREAERRGRLPPAGRTRRHSAEQARWPAPPGCSPWRKTRAGLGGRRPRCPPGRFRPRPHDSRAPRRSPLALLLPAPWPSGLPGGNREEAGSAPFSRRAAPSARWLCRWARWG